MVDRHSCDEVKPEVAFQVLESYVLGCVDFHAFVVDVRSARGDQHVQEEDQIDHIVQHKNLVGQQESRLESNFERDHHAVEHGRNHDENVPFALESVVRFEDEGLFNAVGDQLLVYGLARDELVVGDHLMDLLLIDGSVMMVLVPVVKVPIFAAALGVTVLFVVMMIMWSFVLLEANVVVLVDLDDLGQQVCALLDSVLLELRLNQRGVNVLFHQAGELKNLPKGCLGRQVLCA